MFRVLVVTLKKQQDLFKQLMISSHLLLLALLLIIQILIQLLPLPLILYFAQIQPAISPLKIFFKDINRSLILDVSW